MTTDPRDPAQVRMDDLRVDRFDALAGSVAAATMALCTSEYAECPEHDRRCAQTADHIAVSPLHYNRAGFAWSDDEARESAQRVAAAAAGQNDELPDAWLLALLRQANAEEGLDLADGELLHHGRTDGYIRLARQVYQLGRAAALGYEVTVSETGDRVLVGDRATARSAVTPAADPTCCGQPMVHNSFTGEYECADAYFALIDEGVLGESSLVVQVPNENLTNEQSALLGHWRASRIPDATGQQVPDWARAREPEPLIGKLIDPYDMVLPQRIGRDRP